MRELLELGRDLRRIFTRMDAYCAEIERIDASLTRIEERLESL